MNRIKNKELVLIFPLAVVTVVGMNLGMITWSRFQLDRDLVPPLVHLPEEIPDFAAYTDVKQKKQSFFEYMLPMVRTANAEVLQHRERLHEIADRLDMNQVLTTDEIAFVRDIASLHKVDISSDDAIDAALLDRLLMRVDIVPASLILAQAANESAWGTSRFARDGYNFFGIWCYDAGCGEIPTRRETGKTHKVRSFSSVQEGVNFYIRTINSNNAYSHLRTLRAELRQAGQPITGARLAEGLLRYSERGEAYVEEIQAMIRINNLSQYNIASAERPSNRG